METNEITLFNTNAPNHPKDWITFGMDFIKRASSVYLIITGADKQKVLSDLENQLPIHTLLKKRR
jgi:6-phosphogluconolactonase/glucosamine-6-phosphate isomerase/deaminase